MTADTLDQPDPVVTLGETMALLTTPSGGRHLRGGTALPIGIGDAFVAGCLSALVENQPVAACLRRGNLLGGAVCRAPGDREGLPTPDELARLGSHLEDVVR